MTKQNLTHCYNRQNQTCNNVLWIVKKETMSVVTVWDSQYAVTGSFLTVQANVMKS